MEARSGLTDLRSRRRIARTAGWLAAAALLALAAFAPTASATEDVPDACADAQWSASAPAGENPYPFLTVTVKFEGAVPDGCSLDFSMASYDAEGSSWPTSGTQTLVDFMTVTIDAANPSATLTVAQPECFGQTDFYIGSTRYDGIEAPLPHYPDSPTPIGKISGANGGEACVEEETPPPPANPTPTPTGTDDSVDGTNPTPTGTDLGVGGSNPTPANSPTGQELGAVGGVQVTPPATDAAAATVTSRADALPLVLGAIAVLIALSLLKAPARDRRRR